MASVRKLLLVALGALAVNGEPLWADGVIRDGLGAISSGRGGTNLGFSDNGEILLDNPAAMTNVAGNGLFEVGGDLLFTDLKYSDPDNGRVDAHDNPMPMGQIALIRKSQDGLWAYGLGLYSQAGFSSVYDMNGPLPISGEQRYKSFGSLARILPGVSAKLTDRLSVGGTFGAAISHMEVEAPYYLQGPHPFAGTPTLMDFQGTGAAISWSVGAQYLLSDRTTLGVSYTGETNFHLDGNTLVSVPGLGTTRFDSTLDVEWPSILGAGLRHVVSPCLVLSTDVYWMGWSSSFDSFDLNLTRADNPAIAALTGPSLVDRFPLNWKDSVSVRLGLERSLAGDRVLRAGYVYHDNPIPAGTLTPLIAATLEHAVSVGAGQAWGCYQFDVAYQFSWSGEKTVGQSDFLGGDFSNSNVSTQAHWLMGSVVRRF